ncbi:MAG TPA: ribonuclease E inhibitor RraB, partial [Gemmatimonadaceae bacterium]|nr:ribonuclease E inhibitor RraB [Gemmatimonadaceae bacterium]
APKSPQDADALALRHLAARGADLSKSRHVIHFLYFEAEEDARAAAESIDGVWRATVEPPGEEADAWCVRADGERVLRRETVEAFRSWFENVAETHRGEYDGWEAAAKP